MNMRDLERSEIDCVWQIDRSEVIEAVYHMQGSELVLKPEHYDMVGWPSGEAEEYGPILLDCFDRGGTFIGAFDDTDKLVAVSVLESRRIGKTRDQLQLMFLHVSRAHRGKGLGSKLFALSVARAQALPFCNTFTAHRRLLHESRMPARRRNRSGSL